MKAKIVTITGATCSGKTTLINKLIKTNKQLVKPTQFTTRPPRQNDPTDRDNYNFISKDQFLTKINNKELAEYCVYDSNYYGICVKSLTKAKIDNKTTIFAITYDGIQCLKKYDVLKLLLLPEKPLLPNQYFPSEIERYEHFTRDLQHWAEFDAIIVNKNNKLEQTLLTAQNYIKSFIANV